MITSPLVTVLERLLCGCGSLSDLGIVSLKLSDILGTNLLTDQDINLVLPAFHGLASCPCQWPGVFSAFNFLSFSIVE